MDVTELNEIDEITFGGMNHDIASHDIVDNSVEFETFDGMILTVSIIGYHEQSGTLDELDWESLEEKL